MLNVASSTSTNTGVAPVSATASPVAQNVNDGHSTASPRPTCLAISTISSASVPLAQVTTCLAPLKVRERRLQRGHFRTVDELAMGEHAGDRLIDGFAEPAALRGEVDERNGFWAHMLVHGALQGLRRKTDQPTTRRGPLRAEEAAGLAGASRQRIAISRLATPSSPVTAGTSPVRTASRNAISSARNGSS